MSIGPNIREAKIAERNFVNRFFRIKSISEANLEMLIEMTGYVTLTRNKELKERKAGVR